MASLPAGRQVSEPEDFFPERVRESRGYNFTKMSKKLFIIIILILLPVSLALAQDSFFPCSGADCTICDLGLVLNKIVQLAVQFAFVAATITALVGGGYIMFGGSNPSYIQTGKNAIYGAVIGLIIVLSAWIVVDTIFKVLVGGEAEQTQKIGQPWYELQCPKFAR